MLPNGVHDQIGAVEVDRLDEDALADLVLQELGHPCGPIAGKDHALARVQTGSRSVESDEAKAACNQDHVMTPSCLSFRAVGEESVIRSRIPPRSARRNDTAGR